MPTTPSQAAAILGRKGGSVRDSDRKTKAARLNAKKGGWPKGRPRKPLTAEQKRIAADIRSESKLPDRLGDWLGASDGKKGRPRKPRK